MNLDSLLRFCFLSIAVVAFPLLGSLCVSAQDVAAAPQQTAVVSKTPLGIAKDKPADGRCVEIEGGYMIPYTAMIPGTDVSFTMIPIPGGKFTMGSPEDEEDRGDDEGPQFEVTVEPFWMGKYEVTWAEYKPFMNLYEDMQSLQRKGLRKVSPENEIDGVTAPSPLWDPEYTYGEGDGPDEPAATMSQFAAKQYTKWLSRISGPFYRLPTEAEWEYACRAGTATAYYFGDEADYSGEYSWNYESVDEEFRQVVGGTKPNRFGLYDMSGNVAEWVLDQYDENGYTHIEAGASLTVEQAFRKPTKLFPRVVRGGAFNSPPEECRSAARLGSEKGWKAADPNRPQSPWWVMEAPANGVGFRMIRPLKVPATKEAMNQYWDADLESIMDDVAARIAAQGKGAYGTVDEKLPQDIADLDDDE